MAVMSPFATWDPDPQDSWVGVAVSLVPCFMLRTALGHSGSLRLVSFSPRLSDGLSFSMVGSRAS
eukprot:10862079-Heterocapsa_arctica.AAC.1